MVVRDQILFSNIGSFFFALFTRKLLLKPMSGKVFVLVRLQDVVLAILLKACLILLDFFSVVVFFVNVCE